MAGHKINLKKLVGLLYTHDELSEKEVMETTPFTTATNNIRYRGITLNKQVKDLCDKNFMSLKKEMKMVRLPMLMDR